VTPVSGYGPLRDCDKAVSGFLVSDFIKYSQWMAGRLAEIYAVDVEVMG
jgi:hypothetical protein